MIKQIAISTTILMAAVGALQAGNGMEGFLMSDSGSYAIDGSFGKHTFSDTDSSANWAYVAEEDKKIYQLKGNASTDQNVFGWRAVDVQEPETLWYMFALGADIDGDGTQKFDWVIVSADVQQKSAYKLSGVAEDGTFMYSEAFDLEYDVVYENGKPHVHFSQQHEPEAHSSSSMHADAGSSSSSSSVAASDLSSEQKYALAYMWNEEKLAKDIYLALNEVQPAQVLYNIATRAETQHQAAVEQLVQRYDINITNLVDYAHAYSESELRALAPGQYGIDAIQSLYDALYLKGSQSMQDAYEVGCMVEVTDINDLDEDIAIAADAEDIVRTFESLREGSYNHYWAFDSALKNMGISDGCCVVGEAYCKTAQEYPQNHTNGQDEDHSSSSAQGHAQDEQNQSSSHSNSSQEAHQNGFQRR